MPDSVIEIPEEVLMKMVGFIEVIPFGGTGHPDLQRALGEKMAEIDRFGRPWPRNFFDRLSATDKLWLRDNERQIDNAVFADDRDALDTLLTEREKVLLARRSQHQELAVVARETG